METGWFEVVCLIGVCLFSLLALREFFLTRSLNKKTEKILDEIEEMRK